MTRHDPPPLARLRRGEQLREYADFVKRALRAAMRKRPHPEGRAWTVGDVEDLLQDFFEKGSHTHIFARSADDGALRLQTIVAARNMVIDEQRKSDRGKLHRRLIEILHVDFDEGPAGWWRERGTSEGDTWGGRDADLVTAAWERNVRLVYWSPEAKRDGQLADRGPLVEVLTAVCRRAAGAVDIGTLVYVVARRFNLGQLPRIESLDVPAHRAEDAEGPAPTRADNSADAAAGDPALVALAEEIWTTQLDERERILVPYLASGGRTVEGELDIGLRKSAAHDALERLKAKMRLFLSDLTIDEQSAVLVCLLQRVPRGTVRQGVS